MLAVTNPLFSTIETSATLGLFVLTVPVVRILFSVMSAVSTIAEVAKTLLVLNVSSSDILQVGTSGTLLATVAPFKT